MALIFDSISSEAPGGERDYAVDLTGGLEYEEVLSTVAVTADDPAVLQVTNVTKNTDGVTLNFHVHVEGGAVEKTVTLNIAYTGNSGSADTYEATQPIIEVLPG